jgi:hypothetical protein
MCGGSGRNMKAVNLPKPLGVTMARASSNQSLRVTILDRAGISVKNVVATRISNLTSGK